MEINRKNTLKDGTYLHAEIFQMLLTISPRFRMKWNISLLRKMKRNEERRALTAGFVLVYACHHYRFKLVYTLVISIVRYARVTCTDTTNNVVSSCHCVCTVPPVLFSYISCYLLLALHLNSILFFQFRSYVFSISLLFPTPFLFNSIHAIAFLWCGLS